MKINLFVRFLVFFFIGCIMGNIIYNNILKQKQPHLSEFISCAKEQYINIPICKTT